MKPLISATLPNKINSQLMIVIERGRCGMRHRLALNLATIK